jgi:hypothetical protein
VVIFEKSTWRHNEVAGITVSISIDGGRRFSDQTATYVRADSSGITWSLLEDTPSLKKTTMVGADSPESLEALAKTLVGIAGEMRKINGEEPHTHCESKDQCKWAVKLEEAVKLLARVDRLESRNGPVLPDNELASDIWKFVRQPELDGVGGVMGLLVLVTVVAFTAGFVLADAIKGFSVIREIFKKQNRGE